MSDDEERTAADDAVISKYMQASEIANGRMQHFSFLLMYSVIITDSGLINLFFR